MRPQTDAQHVHMPFLRTPKKCPYTQFWEPLCESGELQRSRPLSRPCGDLDILVPGLILRGRASTKGLWPTSDVVLFLFLRPDRGYTVGGQDSAKRQVIASHHHAAEFRKNTNVAIHTLLIKASLALFNISIKTR